MTTRERIDLLAGAYPGLFPRRELVRLVRAQWGDVDALDWWVVRDGTRVRARAPGLIYHICAGNLAVSAFTSLAHGLLLGSRNVVKLPSEREDSSARREILAFVAGLPVALRKLVEVETEIGGATAAARAFPSATWERGEEGGTLQRAEVVIAFGSDATMRAIRAQLRFDQKFIAHGHALSLLWMAEPNRLTARQARACAVDVLTYDQLGCLSPQAIYVTPETNIKWVGEKLSRALETEWQAQKNKPGRPLGVASRITEARDVALTRGHRVWLPPKKHLGWTLICDPEAAFAPSPLHGVIYLRPVSEAKLAGALASVAGRISTVGVVGEMSPRAEKVFLGLGVTRFCPAGRMQFPPLTWHHDGRSSLSDLVTWIDHEVGQ